MAGESSKILFITRNYPPKVGGLEKYSFHLIEAFSAAMITHKITLSRSKKHLLWFLPYALFKALHKVRKYDVQHVHLCDGLLAPLGLVLRHLTGARVSCSIHGLDVTYPNRLYQRVVPRCLKRFDAVVCVSRATRDEVLKRVGLPAEKIMVIPNGIIPGEMALSLSKEELHVKLENLAGLSLPKGKILFTLGHLVKRKGVPWFVENVFPHLSNEYVYLVAGKGPEREAVQKAIALHHLENRIFLLGEISDTLREVLYNLSDVFVMPNITVPGDVEGFGIVVIEAGSCGLPVVASNIQGLRDAVLNGETGFLVAEGDVGGFVKGIRGMNLERDDIKKRVHETFSWGNVFLNYRRFLLP